MFDPDIAASMMKKRPNFIIGVPTLYEALTKSKKFNKSDLRCLFACFSGADTLTRVLKEKFESIVERQGGKGVRLLEGYGLTEAVTAIMANPYQGQHKIGSIGLPFPDVAMKIVALDGSGELESGHRRGVELRVGDHEVQQRSRVVGERRARDAGALDHAGVSRR